MIPKNYAKTKSLLKDEIIHSAVSWKVAFVDNTEIDEMNILRASIRAMHLAIEGLDKVPQFLLIDGNSSMLIKTLSIRRSSKATVCIFQLQLPLFLQRHFAMSSWKRSIVSSLNSDGIKIKDILPHFTGLPL